MDIRIHQESLTYFLQGSHPRVLLLSGMHGDEYESGNLLEQYLSAHKATLPDFLYIPHVSPSAVAAKERKNKFGNDINRMFIKHTEDPEARTVMDLLTSYRFKLCIDVHEDPDRTMGFYLYDSEQMTENELEEYRASVRKTDARLYTGVDDMEDKHLNLYVEKGYISLGFEKSTGTGGFSSRWLYEERRSRRSFTMEIPGKATRELKRSVIEKIVPFLAFTFGQ